MYVDLVMLDSVTPIVIVGVLVCVLMIPIHALVVVIQLTQLRRPALGKEIFIFVVVRFHSLLLSSFAESHPTILSCAPRELVLHQIRLLPGAPSILRASVQSHSQRITSVAFCRV